MKLFFIYDLDTHIIAVFKRSNGYFVTTCQLTSGEHAELLKTGNFGGENQTVPGKAKNLPPREIQVTETDSKDNGFTPLNSFENDILGISPIDQSQSDDP